VPGFHMPPLRGWGGKNPSRKKRPAVLSDGHHAVYFLMVIPRVTNGAQYWK
jgi:hypothetical protein